MFGRRSSAKERQRASSELRQCTAYAEAGAMAQALIHSRRAEDIIQRLIQREPDEQFHRFVLAGLLYNRATVQDALGEGADALASASRSHELYGSLDPSGGDPSAVAPLLRDFRSASHEIELLIAQAADARARFARILAKYGDRSEANMVHRHGSAAIQTYQALVRTGHHFGKQDVTRVRTQYEEAKAHLTRPAR